MPKTLATPLSISISVLGKNQPQGRMKTHAHLHTISAVARIRSLMHRGESDMDIIRPNLISYLINPDMDKNFRID